jgi:hypothetical protein
MKFPLSGPLGIEQIKNELSDIIDSNSLEQLSLALGFEPPHAISEFYGYGSCDFTLEVLPSILLDLTSEPVSDF